MAGRMPALPALRSLVLAFLLGGGARGGGGRGGVGVGALVFGGLGRLPAGAFEQRVDVLDGDGVVLPLHLGEGREVDADDAPLRAEERRAGAAGGVGRVVDDA